MLHKEGKEVKRKPKKYKVYTYEHTTKIIVALTDKELGKIRTRTKNGSYINIEDYLITVLNSNFEYIEANKVLGLQEHLQELDKEADIISHHELTNPKLIRCKNNMADSKQTILEDYY
ncbi:MAG: hypothetical protein E7Z75_09745 [Methanobrevibacter olleyae]|uniref:Uncharacterized protein n=1 Tax=Methanobrevibacter olleyae TaxID=294671 RepID=A0A8T3VVX0_METOL|nr:hypothetical protein [Methanobrevibacter olleyae]